MVNDETLHSSGGYVEVFSLCECLELTCYLLLILHKLFWGGVYVS